MQANDSTTSVLDVRTEIEFQLGHIAGADNIPTEALLDGEEGERIAKEFLCGLREKGVCVLVLYCMYSQCRGPAIVAMLNSVSFHEGLGIEIALLAGGFHKFLNMVADPQGEGGDVPGLLQDFQKEAWRRTESHGFVEAGAVEGLEELGATTGVVMTEESDPCEGAQSKASEVGAAPTNA